MAPMLPGSIHLDAFHEKFPPGDDLRARGLTGRTDPSISFKGKFMAAGAAAEKSRPLFKGQLGPLGQCAFGHKTKVKLHTLIHDPRKSADDEMDAPDLSGFRLLGMFQRNFENVLRNPKFMHVSILTPLPFSVNEEGSPEKSRGDYEKFRRAEKRKGRNCLSAVTF
jgi:hypothetical protein